MHIVNNLAVPVSLWKSYPIYPRVVRMHFLSELESKAMRCRANAL